MTLAEFKAWFEGYTEGLEAAPTKAQFDRIKEKVKEIDGTVTTYPIYIDRHFYPWYTHTYPSWTFGTTGYATGGLAQQASNNVLAAEVLFGGEPSEHFDSRTAMYALGKAEALQ